MNHEIPPTSEIIKEAGLRKEDMNITLSRHIAYAEWDRGKPCPCHGDTGIHAVAMLISGGKAACMWGRDSAEDDEDLP